MIPVKQSSVPRHPMFRAMVVMGNGIAVGCGGVTTDQRGKVDTTGKDAGAAGSASASAGGISGTGGAIVIGSTGGTNPVGSGGAPVIIGAGGAVAIGVGGSGGQVPACPLAQYDCSGVAMDCGMNDGGWTIPSCACNPNRPLSAKDCAAGAVFVCRKGTTTADGQPLDFPLPFECSCVAAPASCTGCDVAFGGAGQMACDLPADGSVLCGCAFVVLR